MQLYQQTVIIIDHNVPREISNPSFFLLKCHHRLVAGDSVLILLMLVEKPPRHTQDQNTVSVLKLLVSTLLLILF